MLVPAPDVAQKIEAWRQERIQAARQGDGGGGGSEPMAVD
jgi:hypothetical protein